MAGYNLSNLQTDIKNYTEVDANVFTSAILNRFIENAEYRIAYDIPMDSDRFVDQGTMATDVNNIRVPAGTLFVRGVEVFNASNSTEQGNWLEKRDQTFIAEFNPDGDTGVPKYYANYNDKNILVAPTPASALAVQIQYIKNAPHFDSSTTTMLSDQYENLLLYGVLVECFSYLKGPQDMYNLYKTRYDTELQAFALEQMGSRRRGQYTDGVPRTKVPAPSP